VLWTNRPIKDENDNLIGLFSVGTDVTDRKKAEDTVKGLNETLSILNKILRHDILNDLTVVMSACDMIQVDDQGLKQKATKAIMKSVSLIEQMRSLENALVSEEVLSGKSLVSIVESVVNNYPHIKFSIKGDCTVLCDGAIYSAIDNIVRNAVVHGKTDRIDISIHEKDGRCELRIADYGKGIPLDIKDKIFEEGESFGDTRGSGLGLYIVKKVMERYGGEISVEDNKPSGAMFVLKLKKA
jgi:signal transduction histidine kinase